MTSRQISKILISDGWKLVRICGSHHQFRKEGMPLTATVPCHSGSDVSIGVIKSLERTTGLSLRR